MSRHRIDETKACRAVANALTDEEERAIKRRVLTPNPHLVGADVADLLDMGMNHDDALSWREPFWENWPAIVPDALLGYVVLAAAYITGGVPDIHLVHDLDKRAREGIGA